MTKKKFWKYKNKRKSKRKRWNGFYKINQKEDLEDIQKLLKATENNPKKYYYISNAEREEKSYKKIFYITAISLNKYIEKLKQILKIYIDIIILMF